MDTEVIFAFGAVTVSILGALRFSRCTRIKCGCIDIQRDAVEENAHRDGAPPHPHIRPAQTANQDP